jgi:outer membrane biogenesis lipoprotein LolB
MKRLWLIGTMLLLLGACKALKTDFDNTTANTTPELLAGAQAAQSSWNTLNLRGVVMANFEDSSQRISTNIRIESQKQIWINASMIVPIGRAKIDTSGVAFYEVLGKSYYQGDFSAIQKILGVNLGYQALENSLLGRPFLPELLLNARLSKHKSGYQLKARQGKLEFVCRYNQDFLLQYQHVYIGKQQLEVNYFDYQKKSNQWLPMKVNFQAQSHFEQSSLEFNFRNVVVDPPLRFPFQIPKNYTPITP